MFKLKLIVIALGLLLTTGSVALASGRTPELVDKVIDKAGSMVGIDSREDAEDADTGWYDGDVNKGDVDEPGDVPDKNDANPVSEIARDESATGTMTLPNGREIENHGLDVSDLATQQGDNAFGETSGAGQQGDNSLGETSGAGYFQEPPAPPALPQDYDGMPAETPPPSASQRGR